MKAKTTITMIWITLLLIPAYCLAFSWIPHISKRFVTHWFWWNEMFNIIIDKETNCKYFLVSNWWKIAITPLLDKDGKNDCVKITNTTELHIDEYYANIENEK